MSQTLCTIKRENFGATDWYHTAVKSPYYRESDASHWDLCYLRDEDIGTYNVKLGEQWKTAYVSPSTGLLTDTDPGGDSVEVMLKIKKDGVLSDLNPTGRVTGAGAPII